MQCRQLLCGAWYSRHCSSLMLQTKHLLRGSAQCWQGAEQEKLGIWQHVTSAAAPLVSTGCETPARTWPPPPHPFSKPTADQCTISAAAAAMPTAAAAAAAASAAAGCRQHGGGAPALSACSATRCQPVVSTLCGPADMLWWWRLRCLPQCQWLVAAHVLANGASLGELDLLPG